MLLVTFAGGAKAQQIGNLSSPSTPNVFWSQVDTYVGLTRNMDLMLLASGTPGRNADHPTLVLGPNLDIALLPFLTPRIITINPERSKYLSFRVGYRYVRDLSGKGATQNNGVLELTPRFPLPAGFQIADRNRIDLRGLSTGFTWRYRNRVALARSFDIHGFVLTPYAESEIFYNYELGEWSLYNYTFGAISRIKPRVEVDTWFRRQTSITNPANRVNVAGVKLVLLLHTVNGRAAASHPAKSTGASPAQ